MTANVKVEIAFADGAMAASPTWTDVSAYVDLSQGISLNRGRGRTATAAEPGRCSLTLNNDDGRFTWGDPAGAYGLGMGDQPQLRQPLRVSADVGSGYVPIWTGYVDEWVGGWDGGMRPVVRVTASDRVSRLQLVSLNDGAIMSEVLYDSPVAYYPLDEPAGSTSAGDRSGRGGPTLVTVTRSGGSAGTVDFGSGASPDSDGTAVAFTSTSSTNGKHLRAALTPAFTAASYTVEAWVLVPSAGQNVVGLSRTIVTTPGTVTQVSLTVSTGANGELDDGSGTVGSVTSAAAVDDSEWHHFALVKSGTSIELFLDGASAGTDATIPSSAIDADQLTVGTTMTDGQIAHVAVYDTALSAARILAHYEAGQASGSFTGDTADERFTRLCRLAGLDAALYASDATATTVLGAQPLGGIGLMDAIQQVADSEQGLVYVDGAGVLTFLSAATLAANLGGGGGGGGPA